MGRLRFHSGWLSCGMIRLRDFLKSLLLPLLCLPLLLWLHVQPSANSMLNLKYEQYAPDAQGISADYLAEEVQYHQTEPAFARRPLTTQTVLWVHGWSGWLVAYVWLVVQLLGWLVAAVLLYYLAAGGIAGWWAQAFFFTGFSVLFAWFPPVYTFDEPLQYALLLGALLAAQRNAIFGAMLLFGISLLARETGWLLWPAFAWLFGRNSERKALFWALSIFWLLAYLAWWFWGSAMYGVSQQPAGEVLLRLTLLEQNFAADRWGESVWTFVLVLALPLLLSVNSGDTWPKAWRQVFWLTVLLNSPLVFGTAFAREARLFALPLLLAWPFLGSAFKLACLQWWQLGHRRWWIVPIAAILAVWLPQTYVMSGAHPDANYFHEYLTVYLVLLTVVLWAKCNTYLPQAIAPS